MDKLDHKVWDERYEACKKSGIKTHCLGDFQWEVWDRAIDIWRKYGEAGNRNESLLEAYRTGEIRDAGEYHGKETMKVRITKGHGWYMDYVGKIYEVFKEPSKYWLDQYGKVAYVVVDLGFPGVINDSNCTIVDTCKDPLWYQLDPAVFDGLVDDPALFFAQLWASNKRLYDALNPLDIVSSKIGAVLIIEYKAGILRQGGPLEVCETCGHQLPDRD